MQNPEDPRPDEAHYLSREETWLKFMRQELLEQDQTLETTIDDAPPLEQGTESTEHLIDNETLEHNVPIFWGYFLDYVRTTRREPDTIENLKARFYNDKGLKEHLADMEAQGWNSDMVLSQCLTELKGAIILVEEEERYAIFNQDQLPQNVPEGGIYDLPIDAYLRFQGWNPKGVKRVHNMFTRYIMEKDPSLIIQTDDDQHHVAKGYSVGILTVGSLVAFKASNPIGRIMDLADATRDRALQTLEKDVRVYQPIVSGGK